MMGKAVSHIGEVRNESSGYKINQKGKSGLNWDGM